MNQNQWLKSVQEALDKAFEEYKGDKAKAIGMFNAAKVVIRV